MASMLDAQRTGSGGLAKLGEGVRASSDAKTQAGLSRGPNQSKKLINAAWTDTFPAQGATLDLDFANDRGFVRGIGQGRSMDAVTFTRASLGRHVDQNGLLAEAANNEPRFDWASTANIQRNQLASTEAYTFAQLGAVTNAGAYSGALPSGTSAATQILETATTAQHFFRVGSPTFLNVYTGQLTFSIAVLPQGRTRVQILPERVGASQWAGSTFDLVTNTATNTITAGGQTLESSSITDANDGWKIITVTYTPTVSITSLLVCLLDDIVSGSSVSPVYAGDVSKGIAFTRMQIETGDTATTYQAVAQPTTSTPLAANPTSNGLLIEEARTNRILWCRDATQANWVKTNVTAAKDQTGIDGFANAASSLTATANDGTCIQTITLASGSRTGSVYLKRITGTGNVQVSLDGTTYSTVDLSASEWRRIVLSGTVTNPTVGIKLAVSGDAVAMDYGQVEDGAFVTTPILTTAATATRAVDAASISGANFDSWYVQGQGTLTVVFFDTPSLGRYFSISRGTEADYIRFYKQSSTSIRVDITTSSNLSYAMATSGIPNLGAFNSSSLGFVNYNAFASFSGQPSVTETTIRSRLIPINFNIMRIGSDYNGSSPVTTYIKRIKYMPQRFSDNVLQNISGLDL